MSLFPSGTIEPAEVAQYNRLIRRDYEQVRDFVILHYKQTLRRDTPFWRDVAAMDVPQRLAERISLFEAHGRVFLEPGELFTETSWVAVMLGQGLNPRGFDLQARNLPEEQVREQLRRMAALIRRGAEVMPSHAEFLTGPRKAPPVDQLWNRI